MIWKKKSKKYYCRHCGKKHNAYYMAEICFELDMKILASGMKEKESKTKLEH